MQDKLDQEEHSHYREEFGIILHYIKKIYIYF